MCHALQHFSASQMPVGWGIYAVWCSRIFHKAILDLGYSLPDSEISLSPVAGPENKGEVNQKWLTFFLFARGGFKSAFLWCATTYGALSPGENSTIGVRE